MSGRTAELRPKLCPEVATTLKAPILVVYEDAAPGDGGRRLDAVGETTRRRSSAGMHRVELLT